MAAITRPSFKRPIAPVVDNAYMAIAATEAADAAYMHVTSTSPSSHAGGGSDDASSYMQVSATSHSGDGDDAASYMMVAASASGNLEVEMPWNMAAQVQTPTFEHRPISLRDTYLRDSGFNGGDDEIGNDYSSSDDEVEWEVIPADSEQAEEIELTYLSAKVAKLAAIHGIKGGGSVGLSFVNLGQGNIITRVAGAAAVSGDLKVGQKLLAVNGFDVRDCSLIEAEAAIDNCGSLEVDIVVTSAADYQVPEEETGWLADLLKPKLPKKDYIPASPKRRWNPLRILKRKKKKKKGKRGACICACMCACARPLCKQFWSYL